MKITDRYALKTVTTNYNTICKSLDHIQKKVKNLEYHICIKKY